MKKLRPKYQALLLLTLVLVFCLLPTAPALAAPWLPKVPTLEDLSLDQLFQADQHRHGQQPVEAERPGQDEPAVSDPVTASPPAAPPSIEMRTYTVRRGDTLWGISRNQGVTVEQLQAWNGLSGSLINVGQVLIIGPGATSSNAEESPVATHTVKQGETLWSIAARYSTSVASLASANGLSSRGLIHPGDRLTVPSRDSEQAPSRSGSSYRLAWPLQGAITSGWGYRTRFEKFHYGLDIAAVTGTPIKAAMAGVVEFSGWKNGYGYCVFLDHGNGLKTAYGHASKLYVKQGQRVAQNEAIAAVGSTGFSTGPHLHFEVRVNGTLVNPINYLPR
ncbi:MAG: peptidoglycan DD-metalloendopeptidase family protein [Bacillota bacterium]